MCDELDIEHVADCDTSAAAWKLDHWLQFVLKSPFYTKYLPRNQPANNKTIELIICGDGLKTGSAPHTFLLATLGDFGVLSKCILFNFVVNLVAASEKEPDILRQAFRCACMFRSAHSGATTLIFFPYSYNLNLLEKWTYDGYATLPDGKTVPISVHYGGDNSFLCTMLGLKESKYNNICLHCYAERKQCSRSEYSDASCHAHMWWIFSELSD